MELSELLLDAKSAGRGRKPKPLMAVVKRELTEVDLRLPIGDLGTTVPQLTRIRHRHHLIARYIADGIKRQEISLMTGMTPQRIQQLESDPTFKELINYYKSQKEAAYVNVHERIATLGLHSVDELMARLDEKPEDFDTEDLLAIAELALDRSGFGPSKNVNVKGTLGIITGDQLLRIKQEVANRQNGTVEKIDLQADNSLALGGPDVKEPLAEEAEIIQDTEAGTDV